MKPSYTQYLVGILLLGFSAYQFYLWEYVEFSLYITAGAAFITMGVIRDKRFVKYERFLNILSWILIFTAGFLLLFLFRTDG